MSKCKKCGMCCRIIVMPLNMKTDKDAFELLTMKANYVKHVTHAGKIWVVMSSRCIHMTGLGQCKKYDDRPNVCKEWPKKNLKLWKKINPECGYCE